MYRLTETGSALLRLAAPNWERAQERLHRQLGENDWSALLALAERVTLAAVAAEVTPFRNSRPGMIDDQAPMPLDIQGTRPACFPISPAGG
ncbi:MAG: hypothetical protein ACRD3N_09135 [Terracidiphilus sp.]